MIDRSAVHGCSGVSVCFIKSIVTEKDRKRIMLNENEPTINTKFFLLDFAWWMPREVSTFIYVVLAALRTGCRSFAFPDTAASGEDFEAFFAGDLAARSTVRSPTQRPARILGMLTLKIGIPPK